MNVFSLLSDSDHYQSLDLVNEESDWETIYKFSGSQIVSAWHPVAVAVRYDDGQGEQLPPGDYPRLFSGVPVFSARAAETLLPLLQGNGELLPLECREGPYFIFNVTRIVNALDEFRSEVVRFPGQNKIMDIKQFTFIASSLSNVAIFKIPQLPLGGVFVTDRFVEKVRQCGLLGFIFEWLWAADQRSSNPLLHSSKLQ